MEFCGKSIIVDVVCPKNEKLLICANFSRYSESDNEMELSDVITYERLKNRKNNLYPYYFGKVSKDNKTYEINSKLEAWTMNDRLSKDYPQYSFNVYMMIKVKDTKNDYKCVCITKSPPFTIISSRRYRYSKPEKEESSSVDKVEDVKSSKIDDDLMLPLPDSPSPTNIKSKTITENEIISSSNLYDYEIRVSESDLMDRIELTFFGMTLDEAREKAKTGYEYLDKYGNKHVMKADFNSEECDGYLNLYE